MDVHMPSLGGIEAAQRIREQLPDIPIIMLSASDEDEDIFDAVQVGVNGYLIKGEQPEAIPLAIREVVGGHAYLSPRVTKRVLIGVSQALSQHSEIKPRSGLSALTARELTVLRLLGDGSRNRDIAQCLCVSERTVANDIASLYRKLDLSDRTQAVRYAMKHGLTEMAPPE
jgi:DNA-binding NarL/FixJ family response regulator